MASLALSNIAALREHVGKKLGTSDWVEITQRRIDLFADATGCYFFGFLSRAAKTHSLCRWVPNATTVDGFSHPPGSPLAIVASAWDESHSRAYIVGGTNENPKGRLAFFMATLKTPAPGLSSP